MRPRTRGGARPRGTLGFVDTFIDPRTPAVHDVDGVTWRYTPDGQWVTCEPWMANTFRAREDFEEWQLDCTHTGTSDWLACESETECTRQQRIEER